MPAPRPRIAFLVGLALSLPTPSTGAPSDILARRVVACDEAIASVASPGDAQPRIVLNRIAFPPRRFLHQLDPSGTGNEFPYFAKSALVIRNGRAPIAVIVPRAWRNRLAVDWGYSNRGGPEVVAEVRGCEEEREGIWLVYAGGYYVREPACVSVIVRTGRLSRRVRISIGRRCL